MQYLGNFAAEQTVNFLFNTNDSDGLPKAPSETTPGTVSVYKDNDTTPTTTGVTYTPSFNSIEGVNLVSIVTSDYDAGHDYTVVLSGAVIDDETVSAALAMFSLDNRTSDVANKNEVADAVLGRDMADAEASASPMGTRSLATVVLATANKSNTTANPGYLTVYRTDGATEHTKIHVSTASDADPIVGVENDQA